jgi:hypothetical protein
MNKTLTLAQSDKKTVFCIDPSQRGLTRVANTVAADLRAVTGANPRSIRLAGTDDPFSGAAANADTLVVCGISGSNGWIDRAIAEGLFKLPTIHGKRECYALSTLTLNGKDGIIVLGSDLLGAEYGLLQLSLLSGISPWHYWADVSPKPRQSIEIDTALLNTVTEEPLIRLRGFFLNDEWPSLGGWVHATFGGFNELFYEKVFDLLLRLRGNFLWPAMWTGIFSEDGLSRPTASAELASELGISMGTSHHEPLFRAGEEFSYYKTDDNETGYGNDWNYHTNPRGLNEFWNDGVKRNKDFRSLITIGMRGERDSKILGENATLSDNINLLKNTITDQKRLLAQNGLATASKVLALYKEVEDYFYGNAENEGLQSWPELGDVTLLLSDDNFGNTRTLPTEKTRDRKAGWGLYYHFDYHGGPISYEWVNSTPITKAWEQLTTAYEFGVRDLWVANVGDLRPCELPLSYFLALAYDYGRWSQINLTETFLRGWIEEQFGGFGISEDTLGTIYTILNNTTRMNGDRRPEALAPETFCFDENDEAGRELRRAEALEQLTKSCSALIPPERRAAFYGLVEFPALASANLRKMMIYVGMQRLFLKCGSCFANELAELIAERRREDEALIRRYNEEMADGKWNKMMSSKHIHFVNWNAEGSGCPPVHTLTLPQSGEVIAWVVGGETEAVSEGNVFLPLFTSTDDNTARIIVTATGKQNPSFRINASEPWVKLDGREMGVDTFEYSVSIDWGMFPALPEKHSAIITINSREKSVTVGLTAQRIVVDDIGAGILVESRGVISVAAADYFENHPAEDASWQRIDNYGKSAAAMKVFPVNPSTRQSQSHRPDVPSGGHRRPFSPTNAPWLSYRFIINNPGDYYLTVTIAPSNNYEKGRGLQFAVSMDNGDPILIDTLPAGFAAGEPGDKDWCRVVLDNSRRCRLPLSLSRGEHDLRLIAIDPCIVLQKLEISKKPSDSFYGSPPTFRF